MDEDSNATALALRSVESAAGELDPTNLRLKASLEATSTSLGQSLSDKTLVNHDTTGLQDSPTDDTDQLQASSLGSFRAHLFSKFGRKHERPVHIPRPKGPMGLNTLYDPGDVALVDIIFVHGLGGDSKKTWSGSHDTESFWPQDWLPNDPNFKTARIHSFGYDANWRDRRLSILSIHDFGQDLLGEMKNHPSIRRSNTNVVLIGHSMGGNIAKAAYVLARQSLTSDKLASRFHSIIFLGTPHRGSNLAKIGRNILQVMGVSKPYVDDLSANSSYLTDLNSLFQPYAADLHIWSFFETRPVTERPAIVLVDKFSATLGYSHEEVLPLDADHRHICKFSSIEDPNYRKVRNALSRAVEMIQLKGDFISFH
jgi:pimeloyl-ACP methyl ester carboxylesterase